MSSRLARATAYMRRSLPLALFLTMPLSAQAKYLYVSQDAYNVHRNFIADLQANHVDLTNLGEHAIQSVTQEAPFSATPDRIKSMGALLKVCLHMAMKYENGRRFIFRTIHQNGCVDWYITSSADPETVLSVGAATRNLLPSQTDSCGPPVILPLPNSKEIILLPPKVVCLDDVSILQEASPEDEREGCHLWPTLCSRKR
jgi:hypothetical protein